VAQRKIVNQARDLAERVGWTFIQAWVALGALDALNSGISLSVGHQLVVSGTAALAATVKVLIAQRLGRTNDGAAIPGGVVDTAPKP
jgi:ABC-type nickel/cobalt efflux system permease component RcnA